jgi:hypothetical protein
MILEHCLPQTGRPEVVLVVVGTFVVLFGGVSHQLDWGEHLLIEGFDFLLLFGFHAAFSLLVKKYPE